MRGISRRGLAVVVIWAALSWATVLRAGEPVDLELLLAVDTSSSISAEEFTRQIDGLARAFGHPAIAAAIPKAGTRGIAVALVQWAEVDRQVMVIPWTRLRDGADARALAAQIAAVPRAIEGGATGLGAAVSYAAESLLSNRFDGARLVIDISGDGRANDGPIPTRARDRAVASGITVNGLVILDEIPLLDRYFRDTVIGGSGAFVMVADDWVDYAAAILEKLIKEISESPLAMRDVNGEGGVLAIRPEPSPGAYRGIATRLNQ